MPATAQQRDRLIGVICVLATLLIWSGFILLARLGVRTTMAPPDLIALRFAIAGLVMLPWLLRRGLGGLSWPRAIVLSLLAGPGSRRLHSTASCMRRPHMARR